MLLSVYKYIFCHCSLNEVLLAIASYKRILCKQFIFRLCFSPILFKQRFCLANKKGVFDTSFVSHALIKFLLILDFVWPHRFDQERDYNAYFT